MMWLHTVTKEMAFFSSFALKTWVIHCVYPFCKFLFIQSIERDAIVTFIFWESETITAPWQKVSHAAESETIPELVEYPQASNSIQAMLKPSMCKLCKDSI